MKQKPSLPLNTFFVVCLMIVFSYGLALFNDDLVGAIEPWNGSYYQFDVQDYPEYGYNSTAELNREIVFYANYAQKVAKECEDLGSNADNGKTIFCTDFHESDYIRLNYLMFINAFQDVENNYIGRPELGDDKLYSKGLPDADYLAWYRYNLTVPTGGPNYIKEPLGGPSFADCSKADKIYEIMSSPTVAKNDWLLNLKKLQPNFGENACTTYGLSIANALKTCGQKASNQSLADIRAAQLNGAGPENDLAAKKERCLADCDNKDLDTQCTIYGQDYQTSKSCNVEFATEIISGIVIKNDAECKKESDRYNLLESDPKLNESAKSAKKTLDECIAKYVKEKFTIEVNSNKQACVDKCNALTNTTNLPNCYTLYQNLLPQFLSLDRVEKMRDSANGNSNDFRNGSLAVPTWLPLSDAEKYALNYSGALPTDSYDSNIDFDLVKVKSRCSGTGFSAIVCSLSRFLASITDSIYGVIESMLIIPPELLTATDSAGPKPLYQIWTKFRDIANAMFIGVLLFTVFAQLTGFGKQQTQLRTILPRLATAILLINLSYYIVQIAIDISNIVGSSIKTVLDSYSISIVGGNKANINNIFDIVVSILAVGVAGAIAVGAGLAIVLPIVISAFVTGILVVLVLVFRQIAIIMLIILAPLALVAITLPNTQSIYDKWQKIFISQLIVYPLIAATFGAGKFAHAVVQASTPSGGVNGVIDLLSLSLIIMPLLAVPSLLKSSMQSLPEIGKKINGILDRAPKTAKESFKKTDLMQNIARAEARKHHMDKMGTSNVKFYKNPIRAARSSFNRDFVNDFQFYKNRRAEDELDKETQEAITTRFYELLGNSDKATRNVKNLAHANRSNSKPVEKIDNIELMASIMAMAENGDGSLEMYLHAVEKFDKDMGGVDTAALKYTMNKVSEELKTENRYEETALIKEVANKTGGNYKYSMENWSTDFNKTEQQKLIRKELLKATDFKKFKGYGETIKTEDENYGPEMVEIEYSARKNANEAMKDLAKTSPIAFYKLNENVQSNGNEKGRRYMSDINK